MGHARDKDQGPKGELTYKRLEPNTIRVVKFKPATAKWPLIVKIKTIDLHTTKYTALSYTWEIDPEESEFSLDGSVSSGSTVEASHTILINKRPVRISQCLWDVLEQLRDVNSDVPIWIDKLSVDFDDREERAMHANMMGTIYAGASHVIVCLGKKTTTSDDTVLTMRKMVNSLNWRNIPHDFQWDFRNPNLYKVLGINRVSVRQWKNIHEFCSARWFSRLWTFHELAIARQAVFLVGDIWMDYDFLNDFAMILRLTGWLDSLPGVATDGAEEGSIGLTRMLGPVATLRAIPVWHPEHIDHAAWMKAEYNLDTESERAWKFFELILQTCEGFQCQDPRDRIFAPLALVKKIFEGRPVNKLWPVVDYGTSVETVYSHFKSMIQEYTHAPSILATANIKSSPRLTMSWTNSSKIAEHLKNMQKSPRLTNVAYGRASQLISRQHAGARFSQAICVINE
jgi:hypothetical protein